jgi:hypothetical protein
MTGAKVAYTSKFRLVTTLESLEISMMLLPAITKSIFFFKVIREHMFNQHTSLSENFKNLLAEETRMLMQLNAAWERKGI